MRHEKSQDLTINTRYPKYQEGDYRNRLRNDEDARRERIRQKIALVQDAEALGKEISEVWD